MRVLIHSLPLVSLYSFEVSLVGLGILLSILTLASILITGPLLASELLTLSLFLNLGLRLKYHDPKVTGMRTGQPSYGTLVICHVLFMLLPAINLNEAVHLTI